MFNLSHENQEYHILNPVEEVIRTNQSYALTNHAIITHRNGAQFHIEDSATPVTDSEGSTTGVVLIFRDVSKRKAQNAKIEYLSFHDHLTGLYNRRYFEEELNFSEKEIERMNTVCQFHDIRKVTVAKEVLDKNDKLSIDE